MLPPPNRIPTNLHGLTINEYSVGSWCPTPDGTGPATAVGFSLSLNMPGIEHPVDIVMRLKTPESVDTLIQSLLRHKRDVWPEAR